MDKATTGLSLNVILLDDDPQVCGVMAEMLRSFYIYGQVFTFTEYEEALEFSLRREGNLAIFVLDVFLDGHDAFELLGELEDKYPMAAEDTIIITGKADKEVVEKCMQTGVNHLLEKPIRAFTFQFAVQAIAGKYQKFAKRLVSDPDFARNVISLDD